MTTTTARSAYPAAVEELIPRARALAATLDRPLSRNILMKHFRIGSPKATAVLEALATTEAPASTGQDAPSTGRGVLALVPPSAAPPPETPAAPEPTGNGVPDAAPSVEPMPPPPGPGRVTPAEAPEPTRPARSIRPAAVVTLLLSTAAAVTGGLLAGQLSPAVLDSTPTLAAAALGALLTVAGLGWSATAVAGAMLAGRTARDVALAVASWLVAAVAGFLAAYGQVAFAEWAGVTGPERFLVPGILEPAVVVLLLLANRRVKRRRDGHPAKPIGKLLALAALLGGFAVYTNVVHAGGRAGLVFGAATVVGLILWWVKLQDDAAPDVLDDAPHSARLSRRTSRYRLLRWLILFGQTRRAWLISLDHSISDAEVGLDLARRWRRAYDEARATKAGRRTARQHASRHIDAYLIDQH